jgi:amidophosphoribosyltransferase
MCGVLGLVLGDKTNNAATELIEGLWQLQHRGQDACGIAVGRPDHPGYSFKGQGLLSDVFTSNLKPDLFSGSLGVGHGEQINLPNSTEKRTNKT